MPLTFTQVKAFPPEVYTGAGLPAKTHVSEHAERIRGRCFGNRKKVKPLHLLLPSLGVAWRMASRASSGPAAWAA